MKIRTEKQPDGSWVAIDDDTYDCDCDEGGFFTVSPIGHGDTRKEAVYDLFAEIVARVANDNAALDKEAAK